MLLKRLGSMTEISSSIPMLGGKQTKNFNVTALYLRYSVVPIIFKANMEQTTGYPSLKKTLAHKRCLRVIS